MKKLVRKMVSMLLVLAMLLSALPISVLADGSVEPVPGVEITAVPTDAVSEEHADASIVTPGEAPTEEPATEATEEPVVEPTEEPEAVPFEAGYARITAGTALYQDRARQQIYGTLSKNAIVYVLERDVEANILMVAFAHDQEALTGYVRINEATALEDAEVEAYLSEGGAFVKYSGDACLLEVIFTEDEASMMDDVSNDEDFVIDENGVLTKYVGLGGDVVIPDVVVCIGNEAFASCNSLTSVNIPSSVTSIANYAFSNCISLVTIEIPAGVTSIGEGAFSGCSSLTSATLYDAIENMGSNVFAHCNLECILYVRNLEEIFYPEQYCIDNNIPYTKFFYERTSEPVAIMAISSEIEFDETAWELKIKSILSADVDTFGLFNPSIYVVKAADFDGDGNEEAFALVTAHTKFVSYVYETKLMYVDENNLHILLHDIEPKKGTLEIFNLGDKCLFCYKVLIGNRISNWVWAIEDGVPTNLSEQYEGELSHAGGNLFTSEIDDYDGMFHPNAGWSLHTWKPYYYFYENKRFNEYGGIYITIDELLEFDGAAEILAEANADESNITDIIYRGNGIINVNLIRDSDGFRYNEYLTLEYDQSSVRKIGDGAGHYKRASSENAIYPDEFIHPGEKHTCTHENTHSAEDIAARLYSYEILTELYHSVSITKKMVLICNDCGDVINSLSEETELLPNEEHTFVNDICVKCKYERKTTECEHTVTRRVETQEEHTYTQKGDGSGHIHTITKLQVEICDLCGRILGSENQSVESFDEPHERFSVQKNKQDKIVEEIRNDEQHKVQTWQSTIQKCLDCGYEKRNSNMVAEERCAHSYEVTENRTLGEIMTCVECGHYRNLTSTEAVERFLDSMNNDVTLGLNNLVGDWHNQNEAAKFFENVAGLPSMMGDAFNEAKKNILKMTGSYYEDYWKEFVYEMLTEGYKITSSKGLSTTDKTSSKALKQMTKFTKKLEDALKIDKSERASTLLQFLQNIYTANYKLDEYYAKMDEKSAEWAALTENLSKNIIILESIRSSVAQDSDLYKACDEIYNQLIDEIDELTIKIGTVAEHAAGDLLKKGLNEMIKDLPLLNALKKADKYASYVPIYRDFKTMRGKKEEILDLYVIRVELEKELDWAAKNQTSALDYLVELYCDVLEKQYDAAEAYLSKQSDYLMKDAYTVWLKAVQKERENIEKYRLVYSFAEKG